MKKIHAGGKKGDKSLVDSFGFSLPNGLRGFAFLCYKTIVYIQDSRGPRAQAN